MDMTRYRVTMWPHFSTFCESTRSVCLYFLKNFFILLDGYSSAPLSGDDIYELCKYQQLLGLCQIYFLLAALRRVWIPWSVDSETPTFVK